MRDDWWDACKASQHGEILWMREGRQEREGRGEGIYRGREGITTRKERHHQI